MLKDFFRHRSWLRIGRWLTGLLLLAAVTGAAAQTAVEGGAPSSATAVSQDSGTVVIPLRALAVTKTVGNLSVRPSVIDLKLVDIGSVGEASFVLSHTGAGDSDPVNIGTVDVTGADRDEFVIDFAGATTLYPGESIPVNVQLVPQTPGKKSATIRIPIEGATAPTLVLVDGWARYPLTSDLFASVDKLDFGELVVGKTAQSSFTLSNQGEADAPAINISEVQPGGLQASAYSTDFVPTTLAPGESLTVKVTFSAASAGSKPATLDIVHNGANLTIQIPLNGGAIEPQAVPVSFSKSSLDGSSIARATSVQFGPDGRLYVSEVYGLIHVLDVVRKGKNQYAVTAAEQIDLISKVPNHNDDGSPSSETGRLLTGIHLSGTAFAPEIYAVSSDPRMAAGKSGTDSGLDTNSGILHRLYKIGGQWQKQDLVRGLPRSEENHVGNGLLFKDGKLLISMGGHTNEGNRSNNFARIREYALSAAVIEVDVQAIGNGTYDLPTLDDEDRPGVNDQNDPFGGNNGKNQARLTADGPVGIFATGFRNAYDLALTQQGKLYTFDNGPNSGWGGPPPDDCVDKQEDNGGATSPDNLHLVTRGSYAGHPNPTRGNKANTFNASNPQSPVDVAADPRECKYLLGGKGDGALLTLPKSTNGLVEYTATNFGGALQGDLLAADFGNTIHRIELNSAGTKVDAATALIKDAATTLLDITAQGDNQPFPGTIWAVGNSGKQPVYVFEPSDY